MKLTAVENAGTGELYYRGKHPSGLTLLLYPRVGSHTAYASFAARYGSIDNCFQLPGEQGPIAMPEGAAHFLEHKLFESEEGDAFDLFAALGASANASTSFESTRYVFSCTDRFYDSLKILLDFVRTPYFTEQTVRKEQGIIAQEIKMYEDDPVSRVMFNYLRAMYHVHPVRCDIAGSVESIEKISPDHLYRCYRAFYDLSNMTLAVAGRFETEKVLEIVEGLPGEPASPGVRRIFPQEPEMVYRSSVEEKMPVVLPLFQFGYKLHPEKQGRSEKEAAAMEVLLETIASDASPLFQKLLDRRLINESTFTYEYLEGNGYATVSFGGESADPSAAAEMIREEVERCRRQGINPEDFERARRSVYGANLSALNSVAGIANGLVNFSFRGRELFTYLDSFASLRPEDAERMLEEFSSSRCAISVIRPL